MRIRRNYIFVTTLFVGLITLLTNSNVANAQTVILDFENLALSSLTQSAKVTDQFNDKGINFSNATVVDSSAITGFAHSGKQVIESCYGIEFCSAPIVMTFTQPQKRVKVWAGFDYKGKYKLYLRAFDSNNQVITQSIKTVTEPIIVANRINPPGLSVNYSMAILEVNLKSNRIVRAEVGIIVPSGNADTRSVSIDDVEFERGK